MNIIRIKKDFEELLNEITKGLQMENKDSAYVEDDPKNSVFDIKDPKKMLSFSVLLRGPKDTPYQGGLFKLHFSIGPKYPFGPPEVKFGTKIYHPNVNGDAICIDILKQSWSPLLNITRVILSISALLGSPNENDPLNGEAGRMIRTDIKDNTNKFIRTACVWTRKHGIKDPHCEYMVVAGLEEQMEQEQQREQRQLERERQQREQQQLERERRRQQPQLEDASSGDESS